MTPRAAGRTQTCGAREARARRDDAEARFELASLAASDPAPATRKAAAALAVDAGIAAADAACCAALGRRSRSQNHRDAVTLLYSVELGGKAAAGHLERLLGLKDEAQYGFGSVGGAKLSSSLRHAEALVAFARDRVTD